MKLAAVSKISVVRMFDQYIFKLSIPLLGAKRFKLYKIFPIPMTKAGSLFVVKNDHKFLLASIDRNLYQYMNNHDCKPYQNGRSLVCDKPNKFFTSTKSDCVWNIFNHMSKRMCEMQKSNYVSKVWLRINFYLQPFKRSRLPSSVVSMLCTIN